MRMAAYTSQVRARDFYGGVDTVPLPRYLFLSTQTNGFSIRLCYCFPELLFSRTVTRKYVGERDFGC
jgi:hypothetical protein